MSVSDERPVGIVITEGAFSFSVTNLAIDKGEGLEVKPNPDPAEDPDGATSIVRAAGVKFSATVTVTGNITSLAWKVGWIQTIYNCRQSVTYQKPDRTAQGMMISTLDRPRADGDDSVDDHWAWYEPPVDCSVGNSVTVAMTDNPNVPFYPQYQGDRAPWIEGWKAVATAGQMPFCTWLAAEDTDTGTIVYLYHVDWTADFGATLLDGQLSGFTGGTVITGQGSGKGASIPCLEPTAIEADDVPFEPDEELLRLKPTEQ